MRTVLHQRRVRTISFIGIMLLLVACSAPEPTATPVPPTPESVGVIEVTFDGNKCNCTGPEVVPPGLVTIIFHNESDGGAWADFAKHDEGKSWDDMLARIGTPPSPGHRAPWVLAVGRIQTIGGKSISRDFRVTGGLYSLICVRMEPHGVWPGAPLYVEE